MKKKRQEYKKPKIIRLLELGAEESEIRQHIRQRWRQVLIHSCIYYRLNESIIDDSKFDLWARELVQLKNQYPRIASCMIFPKALKKFDGTTGFDLPIGNLQILKVSQNLLEYYKKYERKGAIHVQSKLLSKTNRSHKGRKGHRTIRIHQS